MRQIFPNTGAGRAEETTGLVSCIHCGTPFQASDREQEFCCSGCRFVYHLLHKRGLEDFYRYGEKRAPVSASVFHERAWDWLKELQRTAEAAAKGDGDRASAVVQVQGISCAGCVWLLEAIYREQPGGLCCRTDSTSGLLHVSWQPGRMDLTTYAADVLRFGYVLGPPSGEATDRPMRPLVRKIGLCGALAMNAMLFALPRYLGIDPGDRLATLFDTIGLIIATLSLAVGGTYFFRRAWGALRRGDLHIDLPISLGLAVAYAGSLLAWRTGEISLAYFDFVAVFTFLMLVGRWLQERSVESNRHRLLGLRLSAGKVEVLRNGLETPAPAESLLKGERFRIGRNALVPVRSRLAETPGTFVLNWINGEPAPREFSPGSIVPSGARNVSSGPLALAALEPWADSQLSRLLAFGSSRPWRNLALQRWIRYYLVCVLLLAFAGFMVWGVGGGAWLMAFQVLISVLVVSCPCALGVALPLLDDIAATRLQPLGVYLREHTLWSRLRHVRTILFDKTGTLTLENLALANPSALDSLTPQSQSMLLALVRDSLHPVAACLRESLLAKGTEPATGGSVQETTGMGLERASEQGTWRLGRAGWAGLDTASEGTVFSLEGVPLAVFHFREHVRPGAAAQVEAFRRRGLGVYLLSGDDPSRVHAMARSLGLPESHGLGSLTPQAKADLVRKHWSGNALFLGDGANDSLAFDAALCRGTPAVETGLLEHKADFYLLGRSLAGLCELFAMSIRRRRAASMVFAFAISYNLVAVSLALGGLMNPLLAAILMPLSSLVSIGLVFLFLRTFNPNPNPNPNPTNP